MKRRGLLALALAASACEQPPAETLIVPPPGLIPPLRDPIRVSVQMLEDGILNRPGALHGDPAAVARLAAYLEVLIPELQARRSGDGARLVRLLREGRTVLRAALGIAPEAPGQAVVDQLMAFHAAATRGDLTAAVAQLVPPMAAIRPDDLLDRLGRFVPPPPLLLALREAAPLARGRGGG